MLTWDSQWRESFGCIKTPISTLLVLTYFSTYIQHLIHSDALKMELSLVLLQEGQPVSYISRALMEIEQWFPIIERKLLTIVYGQNKSTITHCLYSTI